MRKRILSVLLAAAMVITAIPPMDVAAKEQSGSSNATAKVVGSNGIEYDDVAYLSEKTYAGLPEDYQEIYRNMCDSIAELKEAGSNVNDVVIYVNENKELIMQGSLPVTFLSAETIEKLLLEEEAAAEGQKSEAVTGEAPAREENPAETVVSSEADPAATANPDETGATEPVETVTEETPQGTPDGTVTEEVPSEAPTENAAEDTDKAVVENPVADAVPTAEVTDGSEINDTENVSESASEEAEDAAETDGIDDIDGVDGIEETDAVSVDSDENGEMSAPFYMENVELAGALEVVPEETIEGIEFVEYDTLIQNMNFFKQQLNGTEKKIYDSMKKSLVTGKKNTFSYTVPGFYSITEMVNAFNALLYTYPNSFNYFDRGDASSFTWRYAYYGGKTNIKGTIKRSKYYSKSLESEANAKVKSLVNAAYDYAAANFPNDPTYGICYYFNDWICRNNYYNMDGTDTKLMGSRTYYYCHTCYGILLKGSGVCESYALTMSRLLDAAGVRNIYVLGQAGGGGHAWNYVQMPDGKWYLLDSTWNDPYPDPASSYVGTSYFLVGDRRDRTSGDGLLTRGKTFTFEPLSTTNYSRVNESTQIAFEKPVIALQPKKKTQIRVSVSAAAGYYSKYKFKWSSSNTSVATVSAKGKVTAGKTPGEATITMKLGGIERTCKVCVYKISKLTFANNKTSLSDSASLRAGSVAVPITVKQNSPVLSASQIASSANLKPTVTTGNKKVATGTATIVGDVIVLNVTLKKAGTAKLKVKFGGKTATYTIKVSK